MSFIENIPTYHKAMKAALDEAYKPLREIAFKLDAHYEAEEKGDHTCDCEYCPYAEYDDSDILNEAELEEFEKKKAAIDEEAKEIRGAIRNLEAYAAWIKHPLPKEELLQ